MKKIFYVTLFFLSLCTFAQSKDDVVIKARLFTVDERVRIQLKYDERLPELNLTDDQLYRYSTIVDDNFYYMGAYNKKQNRTKAEIQKYINERVNDQNKDLKKLLSPEQFKTHLEIYQAVIMTPVQNRLNSL